MRESEMSFAVGMEGIAHPIIELVTIFFPMVMMINERQIIRLCDIADNLHVFRKRRFTVGRGVRQNGAGGLQHGKRVYFLQLIAKLLQVLLEFISRKIARGAAIVHADHQKNHLRRKVPHAPIETGQQLARGIAADGGVNDDVGNASHFKAHALIKMLGVVPRAESVHRAMRDAVAIEKPFDGIGGLKKFRDSLHR